MEITRSLLLRNSESPRRLAPYIQSVKYLLGWHFLKFRTQRSFGTSALGNNFGYIRFPPPHPPSLPSASRMRPRSKATMD